MSLQQEPEIYLEESSSGKSTQFAIALILFLIILGIIIGLIVYFQSTDTGGNGGNGGTGNGGTGNGGNGDSDIDELTEPRMMTERKRQNNTKRNIPRVKPIKNEIAEKPVSGMTIDVGTSEIKGVKKEPTVTIEENKRNKKDIFSEPSEDSLLIEINEKKKRK